PPPPPPVPPAPPTSTDSPSIDTIADAYLAAYTGQHLEELATFYTSASVFNDPTSEGYWNSRFHVEGGDAIVQAMRENCGLIRSFRFEVVRRFSYFDRVVLSGTAHLTMDGAMFGATAGRDYTVALPAVTVLQ